MCHSVQPGTQGGDVTSPRGLLWLSVALPEYFLKTSRKEDQCFIYTAKDICFLPLMSNLNLTWYTVVIDLLTSFGELWVSFDSILFITTNITQILPQYCICGESVLFLHLKRMWNLKKKINKCPQMRITFYFLVSQPMAPPIRSFFYAAYLSHWVFP